MPDHDDHAEFSRLLPFYLNDTLPGSERARVEAELARSEELRAQLDQHRKLMGLVKAGGQQWADSAGSSNPAPEPEVLRLASQPAMAQDAAPGLMAYLSPRNWSPAISLALALAVMAQGAMLMWQGQTIGNLRDENYQLASGQDPAAAKGAILIELKDDAKWTDVLALLEAEGLTIAAGGDFGMLALASDKKDADLAAQIERLRQSPLIASAEPAA